MSAEQIAKEELDVFDRWLLLMDGSAPRGSQEECGTRERNNK
jgi:hypothetical protein